MKVLVISDSHGNIANLKHVMGFAEKIKAKAVIHCGDWSNIESIETVLSYNIPLYSVLGNADIDPKVSEKLKMQSEKFSEDFLKIEIGKEKIGIIHDIKKLKEKNLDIIFLGIGKNRKRFLGTEYGQLTLEHWKTILILQCIIRLLVK